MTAVEKISDILLSEGYTKLLNEKCPKSLLWRPDLLFSKDGYIYLILVKSNNSIPPAYLDRVSRTPSTKYIPLILFGQKLSPSNVSELISLGISIGYFLRGRITHLQVQKKLPKVAIQKEVRKKLEAIDIFISSKQDISEREFILDRLEYLRKSFSYPFTPPHLIEYDKFSLKKLYKHIKEVMSNCEWIVILLEENHSTVVRYEIKLATEIIAHENIFMFVKSTSGCHNCWKKELDRIKELKTIKYLPYNTSQDLEVSLTKAVQKRMLEIQKKKGVKIYS